VAEIPVGGSWSTTTMLFIVMLRDKTDSLALRQ